MSRPEKPKRTAQERALERRQTEQLDKEIAEQEGRLKLLAQGGLSRSNLLSGSSAPTARPGAKPPLVGPRASATTSSRPPILPSAGDL